MFIRKLLYKIVCLVLFSLMLVIKRWECLVIGSAIEGFFINQIASSFYEQVLNAIP